MPRTFVRIVLQLQFKQSVRGFVRSSTDIAYVNAVKVERDTTQIYEILLAGLFSLVLLPFEYILSGNFRDVCLPSPPKNETCMKCLTEIPSSQRVSRSEA